VLGCVFVHDSGYGLCERRRRLAVNAFAGKNGSPALV